jgi:hypothetical protein
MDILRFTTLGAVGFLCCGVAIGVMGTASMVRGVPLWIRAVGVCGMIAGIVAVITVIVTANPVAGGG